MSEQNPKQVDSQTPKDLPFPYYLEITQFSLRLLGIYTLTWAVPTIVTNVAMLLFQWRELPWKGLLDIAESDYVTTSSLMGDLVWAGFGIYLVLRSRWVIEKVFLPSGHELA